MNDNLTRLISRPPNGVLLLYVLIILLLYKIIATVHDVYFGPLSRFPGSKIQAASNIPGIVAMMRGRDNDLMPELHSRYGPIVRAGPKELSFAGGAEAWSDIYGFQKQGQRKPYKDTVFYGNGPEKEASIHSRIRKILSHALSDRALKDQEPILKQWVTKLLFKLTEQANGTDTVDMMKAYNCTTFDLMGDLAFGENLQMLDDGELSSWVKTIFAGTKAGTIIRGVVKLHSVCDWIVRNVLFKTKAARKAAEEHFEYAGKRVEHRLQRDPQRPDLWTKILAKGGGPEGLSMDEHHSTASLFMIAGTETTATALSGVTYHLLRNPKTMAKLTSEIRSTFASLEDVHLDNLAQLKYLWAVLQEGCRLYPPVPIMLPRITPPGGSVICGEYIPGGVTVGVHQLAANRINFSRPDEFHPERWLGDSDFKDDNFRAFEPFSVGPRNCIGKNLAWHEMRLILASVLLCFDLKLCPESVSWNDQRVYTLWEKLPLYCKLTPAEKTSR